MLTAHAFWRLTLTAHAMQRTSRPRRGWIAGRWPLDLHRVRLQFSQPDLELSGPQGRAVRPFPHEPWELADAGSTRADLRDPSSPGYGAAAVQLASWCCPQRRAAGSRKALIGWLAAPSIACGLFFVGMQVYGIHPLRARRVGFTTNLFGSSFYTLTGSTAPSDHRRALASTVWRSVAAAGLQPAKSLNLGWPRCTGTLRRRAGSSSSPLSTSSSEQGPWNP